MNDSPLLDLSESMRKARPLRSWQADQREELRLRLAALHRAWSDEWLPARPDSLMEPQIHVDQFGSTMDMTSDDTACWAFAGTEYREPANLPSFESAPAAAQDAPLAVLRAIASRMFAFDVGGWAVSAQGRPAKIAAVVARAAWTDWLRRIEVLLAGFSLEPQQSEGSRAASSLSDPWSGALSVRWPWCGGIWQLGLPHGAVVALLGSESAAKPPPQSSANALPKEPLDQALASRRVTLRVMLEGTELNLGQLQELRVDDVVPLEHLLDAPAQVVGADGGRVCDGWLGQSDGRMAIELAVSAISGAGMDLRMSNQHSKERK